MATVADHCEPVHSRKLSSVTVEFDADMIKESMKMGADMGQQSSGTKSTSVSTEPSASSLAPPKLVRVATDSSSSCSHEDIKQTHPRTISIPIEIKIVPDDLFHEGSRLEHRGKLDIAFSTYCRYVKFHQFSARGYTRLGIIQWKRGHYADSLKALKQAIILKREESNPSLYEVAEIYLNMGRSHMSLGSNKKAKKTLKKAISLLTFNVEGGRVFTDDHTRLLLAQIMLALGQAHEYTGNLSTALSYLQDALWIQNEIVGASHVEVAASLLSFGSLLVKTEDFDNALNCFDEAYSILKASGSESSVPDMALALVNIGWIHYSRDELVESLDAYQEALRLQRSVLGDNHRNVASALIESGMVRLKLGQLSEALSHFQQALRIQRHCLGDCHADVAITLGMAATAFERLGIYEEATKFVARALRVREAVLGPSHVLVAASLVQLGDTNRAWGRIESALSCYHDAVWIYQEQQVPSNDERVRQVLSSLQELAEEGTFKYITQ